MATTTPDNIWSPDAGDDYALTVDLAAMADTVQDALNNGKTYRVGTDAERVALSGADLFEGLKFWASDTRLEWVYTSGAWTRQMSPFAIAAGKVSPTGVGFTTVNFPAGRFSQPPIVTVQVESGSSGAIGTTARVINVTTTSFQISPTNVYSFMWTAIQMTSGSGSG